MDAVNTIQMDNYKFINSFTLKIIAIITMTIDHVGATLFPQYLFLRIIGRIAFPIFCYLIVEGFFHTKDVKKYLLRLLAFAFISEVPFDMALKSDNGLNINFLNELNVFFTLLFGLLCIAAIDEIKTKKKTTWYSILLRIIIVISSMLLAYYLDTDYSVAGVAFIIIIYMLREKPVKLFIFSAILLYGCFGSIEVYGLIGFLPIAFYNGNKGPSLKYLFYAFYPGHLLILYILKNFLF